MQLGQEDRVFPKEEHSPEMQEVLGALRDHGYPVYSFLQMVIFYRDHLKMILDTIPPGKLLVGEMESLSLDSSVQQMVRFATGWRSAVPINLTIGRRHTHAQN